MAREYTWGAVAVRCGDYVCCSGMACGLLLCVPYVGVLRSHVRRLLHSVLSERFGTCVLYLRTMYIE
jgi:hypothetical protein